MKDRKRAQSRRTGKLAGLILALVLALSLVPSAAFAADSYTSIAKGTVSWKMINENPDTYYWKDSKGGYCALKAVRSGSHYCVTMYTTEKGSELRYLKQKKNDDSGSMQKWSGAQGTYTGGVLYRKTSGGTSGDGGSGSDDSESGASSYRVDGYDKKYSYSALNTGRYYYLYKGAYYQVKGLKYYSKDKGKNYYCGYFVKDETRYYLDKYPRAYTASQLDKEHPGDDDASEAYESCKMSKVSEGKELPLYVAE